MSELKIDFPTLIPKFDQILARGLCSGVGTRNGQMCIEAAICAALDLPHGDDPDCVTPAVRSFKISLNDASWSSPEARAKGLRALGIAQIGSKGVVSDEEFVTLLTEGTIRRLIPTLFREVFPGNQAMLNAALRCEQEGTEDAAWAAAWAAARTAAQAAAQDAAQDAAWTAARVAARVAARGAAQAESDKYLCLSASIALDVLRKLKSPGCAWV